MLSRKGITLKPIDGLDADTLGEPREAGKLKGLPLRQRLLTRTRALPTETKVDMPPPPPRAPRCS
ncbi:MAG: hypothetical protein R3F14_04675 [Polyangiaceae bacterium]